MAFSWLCETCGYENEYNDTSGTATCLCCGSDVSEEKAKSLASELISLRRKKEEQQLDDILKKQRQSQKSQSNPASMELQIEPAKKIEEKPKEQPQEQIHKPKKKTPETSSYLERYTRNGKRIANRIHKVIMPIIILTGTALLLDLAIMLLDLCSTRQWLANMAYIFSISANVSFIAALVTSLIFYFGIININLTMSNKTSFKICNKQIRLCKITGVICALGYKVVTADLPSIYIPEGILHLPGLYVLWGIIWVVFALVCLVTYLIPNLFWGREPVMAKLCKAGFIMALIIFALYLI